MVNDAQVNCFIVVINDKKYECVKYDRNKYALLNQPKYVDGYTVYPLIATKTFADVKIGDVGGYMSLDSNLNTLDRSWVDEGSIVINSTISDDTSIEGDKVIVINSKLDYCGLNTKSAEYQIVIKDSILSDCDLVGKFEISNSKLTKVIRADEDDEATVIKDSTLFEVIMEPALINLINVILDYVIIKDDTYISNVKISSQRVDKVKLSCSNMAQILPDIVVNVCSDNETISKSDIDMAVHKAIEDNKTNKLNNMAKEAILQNSYFKKG